MRNAEQQSRQASPGAGTTDCQVAMLESKQAWSQFAAENSFAGFFYSPRWCQLIEDVFGHRAYCLGASDMREGKNRLAGVLPLVHVKSMLFGSRLVALPFCNWGGPIAPDAGVRASLVAEARRLSVTLGASNLEIRADQAIDCGAPARQHKVRMVLRLPDSREAFQASLAAKVRSQARRPLREGALFRLGGSAELHAFYTVFARNMRDLGTPVLPRRFFTELVDRFPDEVHVALVQVESQTVAAGVLVRNGKRMEIPWAASLREYNRLGVNMMLYSEAIAQAIATGCEEFDFGRSTMDSGTYKFKRQWGAKPEALYWYSWHKDQVDEGPGLSPDNPGFGLAISIWQRLPVWLTKVIGPRLARNLP